MKRFLQFLFISFLFLAGEITLAQTASDYYLPLTVGNYDHLGVSSGNWEAIEMDYNIEGTDSIGGRQYFREVGREIFPNSSDIFHVFWLRKDSVGNIVWGAVSSESTNIDSATFINFDYFPNEFLNKGYSRKITFGKLTGQDSVISTTETVDVTEGTFNNCLETCQTQFDSTGTPVWREFYYYALHVGLIKVVRTLPTNQAHTELLTGYIATGINNAFNNTPSGFSLSQNYPNPFNPTTTINYSLAKEGNVKLTVYNALGSNVATIVNEYKPAGNYSVQFNGSNLASGIYLYRLESGNFSTAKKFILMK